MMCAYLSPNQTQQWPASSSHEKAEDEERTATPYSTNTTLRICNKTAPQTARVSEVEMNHWVQHTSPHNQFPRLHRLSATVSGQGCAAASVQLTQAALPAGPVWVLNGRPLRQGPLALSSRQQQDSAPCSRRTWTTSFFNAHKERTVRPYTESASKTDS